MDEVKEMSFKIKDRPRYEERACGRIITPPPNQALLLDDTSVDLFGPKRRVGRGEHGGHILLCGRKDSYFPFHCMVGPDWPVVVIVFTLIIVIDIIVIPVIAALGWVVFLIAMVGFIGTLISYAAVACTDPGIVYDPDSANRILDGPLQGNSNDLESGPLVPHNHDHTSSDHLGTAAIISPPAPLLTAYDDKKGEEKTQVSGMPSMSTNGGARIMPTNDNASNNTTTVGYPPMPIPLHGPPLSMNTTMQCGQCEIMRPRTARHCNYCGVCVEQLDHHCPCEFIYCCCCCCCFHCCCSNVPFIICRVRTMYWTEKY